MRLCRLTLTTAFLLLISSALSAYTIYLKDGSQLIAKEKYEVADGRALITLSTGTRTSIALDEIDIERTEANNDVDYGGVVVLPDATVQTIPTQQRPKERTTLSQVIQSGVSDRLPRTSTTGNSNSGSNASNGPAGNLANARRSPYAAVDIGNELRQLLRSRGIDQVNIYQGTESQRILVDIVTNSEASVFRALEASAKALATLDEQRPGEIAALELYMTTDRRVRAAQFLLTSDRASELNTSQLDPQQFFLRYVEF
jgi:hypothetical protein